MKADCAVAEELVSRLTSVRSERCPFGLGGNQGSFGYLVSVTKD
jgi:hypothetical protein